MHRKAFKLQRMQYYVKYVKTEDLLMLSKASKLQGMQDYEKYVKTEELVMLNKECKIMLNSLKLGNQ